jgi:uncharacterized protein
MPLNLNLAEPDLTTLDEFLMSDRSTEDSMMLSDLDGFLTAVAIGPKIIMPSEWLPHIWRGEMPAFKDDAEIQAVLGAIMARYNDILRNLDQDEPVCEPIYWHAKNGLEIAGDWAEGFLEGVALRRKAWEPIFADPDAGIAMLPIMALCSDEHGDPLLEFDMEEEREVAAAMPDLVPDCVVTIDDFWRRRDASRSARRTSPKVGRNQVCLCGSGRKFKNCCAIG